MSDEAEKDREYKINGQIYQRIPWGSEKSGDKNPAAGEGPCPDCGALKGQLHMRGCDVEECPACGKQAIACDCDYDRFYGSDI